MKLCGIVATLHLNGDMETISKWHIYLGFVDICQIPSRHYMVDAVISTEFHPYRLISAATYRYDIASPKSKWCFFISKLLIYFHHINIVPISGALMARYHADIDWWKSIREWVAILSISFWYWVTYRRPDVALLSADGCWSNVTNAIITSALSM